MTHSNRTIEGDFRRTQMTELGLRVLHLALAALRIAACAVLAVLEPLIVHGLGFLSLLGFGLCLLFGILITGTHFPIAMTLMFSVVAAILIPLFYALFEALAPK